MPRSTKQSAHAQRDRLRQQAADERVKARDLQISLDVAKAEVEQASGAITEGYAFEDQHAIAQARKAEEHAVAKVRELQHRLDGAVIRVERAQRQVDTVTQQRARDLLEERAPEPRELALKLTREGHELVRLHRAFIAMRTDIDALVGAIPEAVVRSDGPAPSHAWERQLRDLERAIRETAEIEPPLPRWLGMQHRKQQDDVGRLMRSDVA